MIPGIRIAAPPDSDALLALATAFATSFVVEPDAFQQMFLAMLARGLHPIR